MMGTKLNPGACDCYANALPNEPMFVLLARDPRAPMLVRKWARERHLDIGDGKRPESDQPMVDEALVCAYDMEDWRKANDGKWREPRPALAADPAKDLSAGTTIDCSHARRLIEIWERVHSEMDEGKSFDEIYCGFRKELGQPSYLGWKAYMQQSMINALRNIVHSTPSIPPKEGPAQTGAGLAEELERLHRTDLARFSGVAIANAPAILAAPRVAEAHGEAVEALREIVAAFDAQQATGSFSYPNGVKGLDALLSARAVIAKLDASRGTEGPSP